MSGNALVRSYAICSLAGKTFEEWISPYPSTAKDREIFAYSLLHIMLAFFVINGIFLTEEEFKLLLKVISMYDHGLVENVSHQFFIYYYYFVVSHYSHDDVGDNMVDIVLDAIQNIGNDGYLLEIPCFPHRSPLPHPYAPVIRNNTEN